MSTQLTIRLPGVLAGRLVGEARRQGLKRADIVRLALQQFFGLTRRREGTLYERVRPLVGAVETRIPDLGRHHRTHLLRKLAGRA